MKEVVVLKRYSIDDFGVGTIAEDRATLRVNDANIEINISRVYCTDKTEMVNINGIKFPMNIWKKISGSFKFEDFVMSYSTTPELSKGLFIDKINEIKEALNKTEVKTNNFSIRQAIIIDGEEFDFPQNEFTVETQKLFNTFILNNLNTQFLNKIMVNLCKDYQAKEDIDLNNLVTN